MTRALTLALLVVLAHLVADRPNQMRSRPQASPKDRRLASILVYHRFGPTVADRMTVRSATFRWQLQYLKDHGYTVIPLRSLVAYFLTTGGPPPRRAVAITADDGHQSVVTEMAPLVREYGVPVTIFVYPSAISHASYAMTWEQLEGLHQTGLFDIQSHTYWHPNFAVEKRRLDATTYREFARAQLVRSRNVISQKLGVSVDLLAWPFGIYDADLAQWAQEGGYVAGMALGGRPVADSDPIMALPRYLVTDAAVGSHFAAYLP